VHLGIDLGTSNSAVVGHMGTQLRIFKSADGADVLPSAVYMNAQGRRFVGRPAYEQAAINPDNVAREFKRLMGTSTPLRLANGSVTLTPEEVSAEILKTLVLQAQAEVGGVSVEGTIITIPAAFNQMQTEATIAAADLAGISPVGLIHEPIAAAMASMANSSARNGQFLVYDFGGGTFDVALVQSSGGTVNIIAHEGVNMLGGKDFDAALMQNVIAPWLEQTFDLAPEYRLQPEFERLLKRIRLYVERAKIELSTRETASIFVGDDELRVRDRSGRDIYLDVELTRADLEHLVQERVEKTIELCQKIIGDNNFAAGDLDRIVLIGGPSKMPIVRRLVPEALGIPADMATDPMTAVANGAAIYAESRDWSGKLTQRKSSRASANVQAGVPIKFDFPSRTADDTAQVRVTAEGASSGWRIRIDGFDGWSSGDLDLMDRLRISIPLPHPGDHRFRATVTGPGQPPEVTEFTITRTYASSAGVPATLTIAVAVEQDTGGARKETLATLVRKGTILPANGRGQFKAIRTLVGRSEGHIDIKIFQAPEDVSDPDLALMVGAFRLDAERDLEVGETVRSGDPINIIWQMDDNGLLQASVELPQQQRLLETARFYAPQAGHRDFTGENGAQLAEGMLVEAERSVDEVEEVLGETSWLVQQKLKQRLADRRRAVAESNEPDARRQATEEALAVRQEVARLKAAPENQQRVVNHDLVTLEELFESVAEMVTEDALKDRFAQLAATTRRQLTAGDFAQAASTITQMRSLLFGHLITQPPFMIGHFERLRDEKYMATDKALHDKLVNIGHGCIRQEDWTGLRRVISELIGNQYSAPDREPATRLLAGLMSA
jgi:molecular chaperone DnaK